MGAALARERKVAKAVERMGLLAPVKTAKDALCVDDECLQEAISNSAVDSGAVYPAVLAGNLRGGPEANRQPFVASH